MLDAEEKVSALQSSSVDLHRKVDDLEAKCLDRFHQIDTRLTHLERRRAAPAPAAAHGSTDMINRFVGSLDDRVRYAERRLDVLERNNA
jgi:hypothetical protein